MKNEKTLGIDQFIQDEESHANDFLAIVEKDSGNENNVRITPWRGSGCSCALNLSVPKDIVASVERTGGAHYCCGRNHSVVKVHFMKDAALPASDVFRQIAERSTADETREAYPPDDVYAAIPPVQDEHMAFSGRDDMRSTCLPAETFMESCVRQTGPGKYRSGRRQVTIFRNQRTGAICKTESSPCR